MDFSDAPWRGEWIWSPEDVVPTTTSRFGGFPPPDRGDTKILFRREFTLTSRPLTARVRLVSNSRHILFVNGHEIRRGPIRSRAWQVFYDTLNVEDHLVAGSNCLAVLVRHYGAATAWWEPTPLTGPGGAGGLVLEATIDSAEDGAGKRETVTVLSDPSWRVHRTLAWEQRSPLNEVSAQLPEVIDANLLEPHWARPGFDDSRWDSAEIVSTAQFGRPRSTRPPSEPFGVPLPNPLPHPSPRRREPRYMRVVPCPGRANETLEIFREALAYAPSPTGSDPDVPVRLPLQVHADQCVVLDFGGVVSGVVSFRLAAHQGARIAVGLVEACEPTALDSANYIEYTARGSDDEYDSLEFVGGRYALLTVLGEGDVRVEGLAVVEHLRPRPAGLGFHCDDEGLNRLHEIALRTVDLCSRDAYMDCPTREQRAWVGDSIIHQSVDLTGNSNWSLAIRNVQLLGHARSDGLLPMAAAADFAGPGLVTIPDASLHWTRTVHNLYRYTGDRDLVAAMMPAFESVVRWFLPFQREDELLHDVTGWVLIDWAPTEVDGAVASLNGLWGRALIDFAEISAWLGDRGRSEWALGIHSRLREGFERFWDPERRLYADSLQDDTRSRRLSEHAHAAAVVGGLVPDSRRSRVAEILLDRQRIVDPSMRLTDCTPATFFRQNLELRYRPNWDVESELVAAQPYFRYVVHDALALLDRADTLPGLLHDWDRLLEVGPSALREVWRGQSYAHAWSATPARDLVLHVAGISPAEPGFDTVRIAPRLGPLRSLEVTAPTPHGPVRVEVKEGALTIESPRPVILVHLSGATSEHASGRTSVAWPGSPAP